MPRADLPFSADNAIIWAMPLFSHAPVKAGLTMDIHELEYKLLKVLYDNQKMSALFQIDWDDLEQMLHVQLTLFMMQTFLKN